MYDRVEILIDEGNAVNCCYVVYIPRDVGYGLYKMNGKRKIGETRFKVRAPSDLIFRQAPGTWVPVQPSASVSLLNRMHVISCV